ncbi:MAG: orotidine-5'-phosphate decarboxylase, partial [Sediminibacterium sp.]|nr:orotidine-5'-phosphate decarboxylase [Sediminibacterium sp.]
MNVQQLIQQIKLKKNVLCVGLDSDIDKIPAHLNKNQFLFNKEIIDATKAYCVAYKLNTAFYESVGTTGWQALEDTINYIPDTHYIIADAKRGDIGNTAIHYAKTFFETMSFDAVTVSPYMGLDTIQPFLNYPNKVAIVLALTSNMGSNDFQQLTLKTALNDKKLFEEVISQTKKLGDKNKLMFVVGATKIEHLKGIRSLLPNHFLLIPGVGTQGGDLDEILKIALTKDGGILVNVSRDIIFNDNSTNFAQFASIKAME